MASPGPNKLFPPSNLTAFLQHEILPSSSPSSHVLDSFLLHHSDPSFQGSKPLVDFENVSGSTVTELPFFQQGLGKEDNTEEEYDACFHQPAGKKRRLTDQQVQFLEKNFELENKLEPERKIKLGKELGLRPRQVAIWFQNRRARFKTKQLEKDYTTLKSSYDKLKSDYDNLLHQNDKLKEEVNSLKNKLIGRDHEEKEEDYDKCADVLISNNNNVVSENRSKVEKVPTVICKQEDANSAKSDVFDSDSPHHTADSSHAEFETEHSDFSQDEEDNLSRRLHHHHHHHNLLSDLPCLLPKVEEEPCNFGFPSDQDQAFCFWSY